MLVGEKSLFETDDEDGIELEPLGRVECHQRHRARRRVEAVGVGNQSDSLKKFRQRRLVSFGIVGCCGGDQLSGIVALFLIRGRGRLLAVLEIACVGNYEQD